MAKVNIIIRAFNRLEYTSLTIREIDRLAGFDDYKIIVIDQASTDGTGLWLKSLEREGYYKIKAVYLEKNKGDFGGTEVGYEFLDDDCVYTMQWDNDCPPLTQYFLRDIVGIMDEFPLIGQLMLKREGVKHVIQLKNKITHNGVVFGDVDIATCVNIQRREAVEKCDYWVTDESTFWDFNLNRRMRELGYDVKKAENIRVVHIDMYPQSKLMLQEIKYPIYFSNRPKPLTGDKINFNTTNYNK